MCKIDCSTEEYQSNSLACKKHLQRNLFHNESSKLSNYKVVNTLPLWLCAPGTHTS